MNQLIAAKKGIYTSEMKSVAKTEGVPLSVLREDIAKGRTVIFRSTKRKTKKFCGVGKGLRTKVNVNLGTSPEYINLQEEEEKIKISEQYGADAIMDLSTGGDIDGIRKFVIEKSILPLGTVPVYQAAVLGLSKYGDISKIEEDDFINSVIKHAQDGVDFMTIHCGVTKDAIRILEKNKRVTGIVSRGGAILYNWMKANKKENPYFTHYHKLLEIAREYDIVLSLGDGMRPGCLADASDKTQFYELEVLAELADEARRNGVQVIIEGPGHVPLNQIEKNIKLQKKICKGAPFYVLGPLVTDIAPGYDHITGAIGGALAAWYGADFLCYVTPAEHLRLPSVDDVKEGLIASKIAAHAGDIAKGIKNADAIDLTMSKARAKRDWKKQIEYSLDPEKAQRYRESRGIPEDDVCTMCGDFCSLKMAEKCLRG